MAIIHGADSSVQCTFQQKAKEISAPKVLTQT